MSVTRIFIEINNVFKGVRTFTKTLIQAETQQNWGQTAVSIIATS